MSLDIFEQLLSDLRSGTPVCLVTVVATSGSTPRKPGAKMLVYADGRSAGTIGGGLVEQEIVAGARETLATGSARLIRHELHGDAGQTGEMICGGAMQFYLEPYGRARHLYIFGGGHCGLALADAAARVGFIIHVLDDRPDIVTRERFPLAASLTHGDYTTLAADVELHPDAYIAIMTENHQGDAGVLACVIDRDCVYVGLMASSRKREHTYAALRAQGIDADALMRVHSPIGLAIGSETPEEIAVSIVAELIETARTLAAERASTA
jgi:xanthine dehydrogenase accessory factor